MVVRYLTGDPPALANQAAVIIDSQEDLRVTDVVLAETGYVLMSVYGVPREVVVENLLLLVQKRNITPFGLDKGIVLEGLLLCRPSGRVSFADAMVWAAARSAGSEVVYSFDERFPRDGLDIRQSA